MIYSYNKTNEIH